MSKNNPETPPNIQMTPVEFSPQTSEDDLGPANARVPLNEVHFPIAIPISIILLTLIYSTGRDIAGFNRRIADIDRQNAPFVEKLKKVPKQTEFIESLRTGMVKISPTDPRAAAILRQYFPAPTKSDQGDVNPASAPTPIPSQTPAPAPPK
jgi:hypothetical protein